MLWIGAILFVAALTAVWLNPISLINRLAAVTLALIVCELIITQKLLTLTHPKGFVITTLIVISNFCQPLGRQSSDSWSHLWQTILAATAHHLDHPRYTYPTGKLGWRNSCRQRCHLVCLCVSLAALVNGSVLSYNAVHHFSPGQPPENHYRSWRTSN